MGWSCTAEADKTLMNLGKVHFNSTNFRKENGFLFSFDVGREQKDGSIIGTIEKAQFSQNIEGFEHYDLIKKSSFKISQNGELIRFPKWALKRGVQ